MVALRASPEAALPMVLFHPDQLLLPLKPIGLSAQSGDFNGDGVWDCSDANILSGAILDGGDPVPFYMNSDEPPKAIRDCRTQMN